MSDSQDMERVAARLATGNLPPDEPSCGGTASEAQSQSENIVREPEELFRPGTATEQTVSLALTATVRELVGHLRFAVKLLEPWAGGTAQVEVMRAAIAKAERGA